MVLDAQGTGRLYVVGTPIGNLGDCSARAAAAFAAADVICCEDTRVTAKLLAHLKCSRPLIRCDEHVITRRSAELVERMRAGETFAFASDAGMPGVSDPGQVLVDAARSAGVPVEVIPGPTACITALVSSGIACEHFFFEGFLPRRHTERVRRLRQLAPIPGSLLFYESPHRTVASLKAIAEVCATREVAVCRELTKLHEEVYRGLAPEVLDVFSSRGEIRGEVVLVVAPPHADELLEYTEALEPVDPHEQLICAAREALEAGEPLSSAAKRLSQRFSRRRREVYELMVSLQEDEQDEFGGAREG